MTDKPTPTPEEIERARVHYDFGGWAFCGVNAKKPSLTERDGNVTCKRCRDKIGRQDA